MFRRLLLRVELICRRLLLSPHKSRILIVSSVILLVWMVNMFNVTSSIELWQRALPVLIYPLNSLTWNGKKRVSTEECKSSSLCVVYVSN